MTISKEQANDLATYLLNNDIRGFCIDNYIEFNKFQLNGNEPCIFTEEEYAKYEMEMIEQWLQ